MSSLAVAAFEVSMSRNRSLDDVSVYVHTDEELRKMKYGSRANYFEDKIKGYKCQDDAKKRTIENFIDVGWFFAQMKAHKKCERCGDAFYITNFDGKTNRNVTADRLNNNLCHSVENCRLLCLKCNRQIR